MRQSNRTVEEPEHKTTRESNRVVADEHHDVRQSNRAVDGTKSHEVRESNRTQGGSQHHPHTNRVSNRKPSSEPVEQITLQVSDGNAQRRIRNANIYPIGQTVVLKCQQTTGVRARIGCTVLLPDGTKAHPLVVDNTTALFRPSLAGQHRYTFSARNAGNTAVNSAIFVAEQ